jgi:hypothetical protein
VPTPARSYEAAEVVRRSRGEVGPVASHASVDRPNVIGMAVTRTKLRKGGCG